MTEEIQIFKEKQLDTKSFGMQQQKKENLFDSQLYFLDFYQFINYSDEAQAYLKITLLYIKIGKQI